MNNRTNEPDSAAENPYAPPTGTVAPAPLPPVPGILRRTLFMLALPWLLFLGLVIISLIQEIESDSIAVAVIFVVTVPSLFVAVFTPLRFGAKLGLGLGYATLVWVTFYFLFD